MRLVACVLVASGLGACGDNTPGTPRQTLSGIESATCAIDTGGSLYCWGRLHGDAEPGTGEQGDPATGLPRLHNDQRWLEVAASASHACAIREDGTLWCWGRNCAGQLGDATRTPRAEPLQVGDRAFWRHVTTGGGKSCAIDVHGRLSCWGGLDLGQDDCTATPMQGPERVEGTWLAVSASWYATHAIRNDGTLWRWRDHALDDQPTTPFEAPAQLGTSRWRAIASGLFGVYGVREDGSLAFVAFEGDTEEPIGSDTDWSETLAARDHACAIKQDSTLWCWGRNDMGQLGTGASSTDVALPQQVGAAAGWTAVTAGFSSSCGVNGGEVYCWGANPAGEVGVGMPYDHEVRAPQHIGVTLHVD